MSVIDEISDQAVKHTFAQYPLLPLEKLLNIRQLILEVARENKEIGVLEETLKWGEPSYLSKKGSTVRIVWKHSKPDKYMIYFNCKTRLVDTFKEIYGDVFIFEGNRAVVFDLDQHIPIDELKHCILLSLTYHDIKHLPLLGA
jgi:hypothetical protein